MKVVIFLKIIYSSLEISGVISKLLHNIEKGNHDDKWCEEYCKDYEDIFGQKLPDCQFKGNKSKIQSLIRKVKIDSDGHGTEVQFGIKFGHKVNFSRSFSF